MLAYCDGLLQTRFTSTFCPRILFSTSRDSVRTLFTQVLVELFTSSQHSISTIAEAHSIVLHAPQRCTIVSVVHRPHKYASIIEAYESPKYSLGQRHYVVHKHLYKHLGEIEY